MNPKDKAKELVENFAKIMPNENWKDRAIECALIAVDEIISLDPNDRIIHLAYWQQVKQEIQNL